jgi:RNA polymerase sigma factor (TIGR02999 family)
LKSELLSGIIPVRLQISEDFDAGLPTVACGHALTAVVLGWILSMTDVTRILNAIEKGDTRAADKLLPLVYEELRLLAAQKLSQEKPGQTLQATALVHEAYIRLVKGEDQSWNSRGHFFKAAAEAMRRILIENARRKKSLKYGGDRQRVDLDEAVMSIEASSEDLLALDEALDKLAQRDEMKADLVKLRYFAGLTCEQASRILGISHSTADEHWAYARAWLKAELTAQDDSTTT